MRRAYLVFLAGLFLLSCSSGDSDLSKRRLKGEVSMITETQHEAIHKNDQWTPGKSLYGKRIIRYDKAGMYQGTAILTDAGDTLGITRIRREDGEMVEEVFRSSVNGRSTRTIMDKVSDEQTNFEVWEGDAQRYEGAFFYDSRGRTIRQVQVYDDMEESTYFVFEKDLVVESYQENEQGSRTNTQLFEYPEFDETGNWIKRLVYLDEDRIVPEVITLRNYTYY